MDDILKFWTTCVLAWNCSRNLKHLFSSCWCLIQRRLVIFFLIFAGFLCWITSEVFWFTLVRRCNSEYCEICAKKKLSDTPDSTDTFEGKPWTPFLSKDLFFYVMFCLFCFCRLSFCCCMINTMVFYPILTNLGLFSYWNLVKI